MKKVFVLIIAIIIIGLLGTVESTYKREAEVVSTKGDTVTVVDKCGYMWEYKGTATIGDNVTLIMNDNHTSKITDDIIKRVK